MLLIYLSKNQWAVWNIFGSLRDPVKLENQGFTMELPRLSLNPYDKYLYLNHLKENGGQGWKQLSSEESELVNYYHMLEPCHSIQVWYDQGSKRSLEFIYVPLSHSRSFHAHDILLNDVNKWESKIIENILIETKDYELVNDILSFGESIHIPQYFSWSGEKNTIRTAFLVVDIIPELYKSDEKKNEEKDDDIYENETDSKLESYAYYSQKLFYNPCFCNKSLDLLSFEFLEISPKSGDLLKVFIPITQLIPQDSELDLQEIDYDKIVDIRMVPLTDFTTTKRLLDKNFKEEDYSPFIRLIMNLIKKDEYEILYENPSMGAVMNWM
ncbi:5009_t:CDS:2, partial [Racocetra persica]